MTQETEAESIELAIVSCETCDQLFLVSPRRQNCPTCGGPAGLIFFEFVAGPDGLHAKDAALAAVAPPPAPPPAEAPSGEPVEVRDAEVAERPRGLETLKAWEVFPLTVESFLAGREATEDDLRTMLLDLGAEPEEAATAVGRLLAIRALLQTLGFPLPVAGHDCEPPEPTQGQGEQDSVSSESI